MANSLLAALVYGVPSHEIEGPQIPLPSTVDELQNLLTPKGWKFMPDASQYINSTIRVDWRGITSFQHAIEDGKLHSDSLEIASTEGKKDLLIVKCPEKKISLLLNGIIIASRQR